jgi:hypothetical protein
MHAQIGVLRALNQNVKRVFNPDRKDTHWQNGLKRASDRHWADIGKTSRQETCERPLSLRAMRRADPIPRSWEGAGARGTAVPSGENVVRTMYVKKPESEVDGWDEAEAALAAARQMPGGPERIAALKKAGQLRFSADELRRVIRDQERVSKLELDRLIKAQRLLKTIY